VPLFTSGGLGFGLDLGLKNLVLFTSLEFAYASTAVPQCYKHSTTYATKNWVDTSIFTSHWIWIAVQWQSNCDFIHRLL